MTFVAPPVGDRRLGPLVEHLWYCEIDDAAGTETVLPTGRAQLIHCLKRYIAREIDRELIRLPVDNP